jgi:hypothetical protein
MRSSSAACTLFSILAASAASPALAVDPWEFNGYGDDGPHRINTLTHGAEQWHDLDQAGGPIDQDWMHIPTVAGHSYEARVTGTNTPINSICQNICGQFERVSKNGTVLQEDEGVIVGVPSFVTEDRTIRWVASATLNQEYIRVTGETVNPSSVGSVYTIRFWDTTYSIPRWNAANGQVTVLFVQNVTERAVTGTIRFFSAAGTLLHTEPLAVGENQLKVFNTSSVPALVGQSGHAYVAHTAGYGGLAGKAVALEPATGFTFDTHMQAIPD